MRLFETNVRLRPHKRYKPLVKSLVHDGKGAYKKIKEVYKTPFSRNIDLWFFVFCLAIKKGLDPINVRDSEGYNLIADASVISSEMQAFMAIVAIEHSDDINIIKSQGAMIKICNAYASAGFKHIEGLINDGGGKENFEIINKLLKEIMS